MENNNPNYVYQNVIQIDDQASSRKFIANVFAWMFGALAISAICAFIFNTNLALESLVRDPYTLAPTGLGIILMIAPLAFILLMNFGLNKISFGGLAIIYVLYAACTGISLSILLYIYTTSSVMGVFVASSAMFGVMAVAGYTTHTDLTKFGSIMIMLLVGIIIASVVNMFIRSSGLFMLINYVGVAVFVGLTAYKVQMLKRIGAGLEYGSAESKKLALMGGLSLYLTFVNLFIRLLMIFGRRR